MADYNTPPLKVTLPFGDDEYEFFLNIRMIAEVQTKCGVGIGQIYSRVFLGDYYADDLIETVRHGLLGAGMEPIRTNQLIKNYGDSMPLEHWRTTALAILETVTHGFTPKNGGGESDGKKTQTKTDGST